MIVRRPAIARSLAAWSHHFEEMPGPLTAFEIRPGALFHWVTKTDDGVKVVDVWESPEQFQAFADSQIGPFSAEAGLGEPEVTAYPVHNYLVGPDL